VVITIRKSSNPIPPRARVRVDRRGSTITGDGAVTVTGLPSGGGGGGIDGGVDGGFGGGAPFIRIVAGSSDSGSGAAACFGRAPPGPPRAGPRTSTVFASSSSVRGTAAAAGRRAGMGGALRRIVFSSDGSG